MSTTTFAGNLARLAPEPLPTPAGLVTKYYTADEVNFTPGERSFVAWVSVEVVDHEGDVVVASGIDYKSVYMTNPVVLCVHDYGKWPAGQCEWLKVKTSPKWTGLYGKANIDDTPDTEVVWQKIQLRTVRGVSIGFVAPDDMKKSEWGPPTAEEVKRNPHWSGAKRVIRRCKMIEFSICPIGMNPASLIEAVSKGLHKPRFSTPEVTVDKPEPTPAVGSETVLKAAVPYKSHPVKDEAWDAAAAVERLRKWASSDGSGAKDKMDWGKYAEGFAVVDGPKDAFDSYKLPHHDVVGGKLVTIPAGVSAAIGAVNGARGGYQGADKDGAMAHLNKHDSDIKEGKDKEKSLTDAVTKTGDPPDKGTYAMPTDDDSDEPDDDDDDKFPVRKGNFVNVVKGPQRGHVGKVVSVHRSGLVPDVDDDVPATKTDPACRVKCYKAMGDGHRETEHHIGCKMAHCERTNELKVPSRKKGLPDPVTLPPLVGKSDAEIAADRLRELRRAITPERVSELVQRQVDKALGAV